MWAIWIILGAVAIGTLYLLVNFLGPKKCSKCRVTMRLLTVNCGKTKKYECPKCKHRVDTGIPTGRGKR